MSFAMIKAALPLAMALGVAIPFVASTPAKAASCPDILREAEKAYNQFEAATALGDEGNMAKYYVRFENKIKLARNQGCM